MGRLHQEGAATPQRDGCPARGHSAVGRQGWGPAPDQHRAGAQNMASAVHRGPAGRAPGRNASSTSPSRPPASWDPRAAQLGLQGPAGDGLRGAPRARGCHRMVTLARLLGMEEIICERLRAIGPGGETPHGVGAVTREGPGTGAEGPGKREPSEGWHPAGRALSPGRAQLGPNPRGANRWNGPQGPGDKTKGPR